jgi:hypothetical protein
MPTIEDLGQKLKAKHPGAYDDLSDADVGRRLQQKYPGAYDDFVDSAAAGRSAMTLQGGQGRIPVDPGVLRLVAGSLTPGQHRQGGGATVGEIAGGVLGARFPGLGPVLGSVLGAGLGELTQQHVAGQPFDPVAAGKEMAFTYVPEQAASLVKGPLVSILRGTPGGKLLRFDEAAKQARKMPGVVFKPPERETVDRMFELVRRAGVKVDVAEYRTFLQGLSQGKFDDYLSEVATIDRANKTGGRFFQLTQRLRTGGPIVAFDVGELQQLRSDLRTRREALGATGPAEARQLLQDAQDAVDDAIDFGLARGRVPKGDVSALLQAARADYARLRSAEEMAEAVEKSITSTPDISMATFNLRSFYDTLRKNTTKQAQQINRALDLTPGARDRFYDTLGQLSQLYERIEMPMADVVGLRRVPIIASLGQWLSLLMTTDVGRRLFTDVVTQQQGRPTVSVLANLANLARRDHAAHPRVVGGPPAQGTFPQIPLREPGQAVTLPRD